MYAPPCGQVVCFSTQISSVVSKQTGNVTAIVLWKGWENVARMIAYLEFSLTKKRFGLCSFTMYCVLICSEMMNTPVRRIDEILALHVSVDDFNDVDLPPSDDDSWLYNGEDELNAAIAERQKEMEAYESKRQRKKSSREQRGTNHSSIPQLDDFDFGEMAKSMQEFVTKVSSYEGAEVPKDRYLCSLSFVMF